MAFAAGLRVVGRAETVRDGLDFLEDEAVVVERIEIDVHPVGRRGVRELVPRIRQDCRGAQGSHVAVPKRFVLG